MVNGVHWHFNGKWRSAIGQWRHWRVDWNSSVVPYLSIGPIGQLAHLFPVVRQFRHFDQLVPN